MASSPHIAQNISRFSRCMQIQERLCSLRSTALVWADIFAIVIKRTMGARSRRWLEQQHCYGVCPALACVHVCMCACLCLSVTCINGRAMEESMSRLEESFTLSPSVDYMITQ